MNLYIVSTDATHRIALGKSDAQELKTKYEWDGNSPTVRIISDTTDVTGDFE